jgi:hypothetical protein
LTDVLNVILPVMLENEITTNVPPAIIFRENYFRKISIGIVKVALAILLRLPAFSICPLDDVAFFLAATTNSTNAMQDIAILNGAPELTMSATNENGKEVLLPQPPMGVI